MRALLLAVVVASLLAPLASAYPDPDAATTRVTSRCLDAYDRRFVFDYVGAYGEPWASETEGAACDVYERTNAHVILVAVHDTEGETLENYAFHLFETWGVGDAERLDGLMLLYVEDYRESGSASAVRIEVGYGLEGVVNGPRSAETIRLMQDAKARAAEAGKTPAEARAFGLATGMHALLTLVMEGYTEGGFPEPVPERPPLVFWVYVILLAALVAAALAASARRPRRGWGYYPGSGAWVGGLGGAFGGGSFGGGGSWGGGGFGGGRSGGGGGSGGF